MVTRRRKSHRGHNLKVGAAWLAGLAVVVGLTVTAHRVVSGFRQNSDKPAATVSTPNAGGLVAQSPAAPGSAPSEEVITLTSDELRRQVADNELAADGRFKDRLLEITGLLTTVRQESSLVGILFGRLGDPVPSLLAEIDRRDRDGALGLRPGQTVTVRGRYMGKLQSGHVGLGGCRLVSGTPAEPR